MLQVYDRVLGSRSEETLAALFVLISGLFLLYGVLEFARGRAMARVGARLHAAMGKRTFAAVIERMALKRTETPPGALQDLEAVRSLFAAPVLLALLDMPWTPFFLASIFLFHPLLGWFCVAGGGLLVLIAVLNQVLTASKVAAAQKPALAAYGIARQAEQGGELIWAQGMTPVMASRWSNAQDEALVLSLRANDWTGTFSALTKALRLFLQSAILALGALLVLDGEITAGAMIATSILFGRALAPIEQAIGQWQLVQRGHSGWRALNQFLVAIPERAVPTRLPPPEARLSVRGLSVVARKGEAPILHNINFDVAPGQVLGVIGRSGSGKTTLARAIVGVVPATTGEIRLGGAKLDRYTQQELGRYIGYLPQELSLFDASIAQNIAQMDLHPDPDRVVAAARKARVHDIVLKLPEGYDTRIGQGDAQLSGGQKQRLSLARSLYNDPVVLVLDEPNSALDAEGAEALNAAIVEMKQAGKAVLLMTHRPTAISVCDTLLMLDHGKIAAYGPRDDVIASTLRNAGDVQRVVDRNPAA